MRSGENLHSQRYLGLELAGAKNQKTSLAAIEFYPREQKIFLLDIYDRIIPNKKDTGEEQTGDEALVDILEELQPGVARMGVNVPLELPPCITCPRQGCTIEEHCNIPSVKWMREATRKAARRYQAEKDIRAREFTPYTQRPVELWLRYSVMPELPRECRFEIDETLGGNKAPLTARMHFLKRHLKDFHPVEISPKLSVAILAAQMGLSRRVIASYRQLEEGAQARSEIIETLAAEEGIFIYERDVRKLSQSLTSFDAFVCAYTALLSDTGRCAKVPKGFPVASGWVHYPAL